MTFTQDARGEDERPFRVPLPFPNAHKFLCHRRHDPVAESSFGRVVHWMRVSNHPVLPLLPDAVVRNTTIHVPSIIPMDSVSVDTMKQVVAFEYLRIAQVFISFDVRYLY